MKRSLLLSTFLLLIMMGFSQRSNLVIFSENGERFQVVLNGILQNAHAETNVLITDLIAPTYKAKIIFANQKIPALEKTVYLNEPNNQLTLRLKQNRKGKYVLRMFNMVPLAQAPPPPPSQSRVVYTTQPAVATTITHSTTTTTNHGGQAGGDHVNMNVNVGGISMNMNVDVNDGGNQTSYSETHTSTTTTSHTGGVHNGGVEVYVLPGYSGPHGCPYPMSKADFAQAKRSIAAKDFSDSRLTLAKQIIDSNCLLSTQVMQMMELFDFEDGKLELAKYAYGYTLDYGNYYRVNDAFTFESSIDELNEYMNSFTR